MTQFCGRCGGIFSAQMTIEYGEDGKPYHSYCSWANWKDKQRKLEKEHEDANKLRQERWGSNILPRK